MNVLDEMVKVLLLYIPTNFLVLYGALSLQGRPPLAARLVPFSVLGGLTLALFRSFPNLAGLHVPLQALVIVIFIRLLSDGRWPMVFLGVLVTQVLLAVGEGLIALPVFALSQITISDVLTSTSLQLAMGWMANIPLLALCIHYYLRSQSREERTA